MNPRGTPVCRGRARRRTEETGKRKEHKLPSVAVAEGFDDGRSERDQGASRLQQIAAPALLPRRHDLGPHESESGHQVSAATTL